MSRRLSLLLLLVGCAHAPAAPPFDPNSFRSPEGFEDARWGMTPADLQARLAEAERPDPTTYRVREPVEGKPAIVTYGFPNGHLADLTVEFQPPIGTPPDFDQSFDLLARQYGPPLPSPGARNEERDAAITVAAIFAAVLVVGILVAIATKGGGGRVGVPGGAVHAASAIGHAVPPAGIIHPLHPAVWIDLDALRLTADALDLAIIAGDPALHGPHPLGGWMAEWRTHDTEVVLFGMGLDWPGGKVVESYRSVQLNPPATR